MRITIEFNDLSEIHGFIEHQSEVEKKVIVAVAKKLPKEMAKIEREISYLRARSYHLQDMERALQDQLVKNDVVINYLTRKENYNEEESK